MLALIAFGLWTIRPFGPIRGFFMIFWRHPALFTLPFLAGLGGALLFIAFRNLEDAAKPKDERRRPRAYVRGAVAYWFVFGSIALIVAIIWTSAWTSESLYEHTTYGQLTPAMLDGNQARIKPYGVAWSQLKTTLNSSTDNVNYTNVGRINGHLVFTSVRVPNGSFRGLTHSANGILVLGAESSTPSLTVGTKETSGTFKYNPGSKFGKNFGWHAHKICYTCDITEVVGVPTANGPLLVAPYVKWEGGWFVTHPIFGGVFVEDTHGSFQMLSAKQAESDPRLTAFGGDLFPETLARRIAQAYAYKHGIANKVFTHKDQYEVEADENDGNYQPYLEYFKGLGMQWVTMLKPTGETETMGALILTSAVSGQTRIWRVPQSTPLIGSNKAVELVSGEAGLGVNALETVAQEPRPVFLPNHELQYLVSITPDSEARTTLNVIVNARQQTVIAAFQPDAKGDALLSKYLQTGILSPKDRFNGTGAGNRTGETSSPTQEAPEE